MSDLICRGGNVKALPDGRISGYLVVFGTADTPDLSNQKDFFTADTDYGIEDGMKSAVYYAHALDSTLKNRRLTNVSMKVDDVGVWVEGQIKARDEYEQAILEMAQAGKLGWSSGTASHLVTRKAIQTENGTAHEILSWPLGLDASLTPTPAEPRASVLTIKSLAASLPDLLSDDATKAAAKESGISDDTKALPDGWSYRDLMRFLESEANEDFGVQGSYDPWDAYTPSVYICGCNLLENPDRFVYGRTNAPGDTFSRTYTIENNDVVWGDEQEVIETTTYVNAPDDDAPMMAGKQVDVTALKAMLRASMTLDDHASIALDAVGGFVARAENLSHLAIKAGKPMSAARHAKLTQAYAGMRTAHTAMETHLGAINEMLLSTDPDAKKDAEEVEALRTQFIRLQSAQLRMAG